MTPLREVFEAGEGLFKALRLMPCRCLKAWQRGDQGVTLGVVQVCSRCTALERWEPIREVEQ